MAPSQTLGFQRRSGGTTERKVIHGTDLESVSTNTETKQNQNENDERARVVEDGLRSEWKKSGTLSRHSKPAEDYAFYPMTLITLFGKKMSSNLCCKSKLFVLALAVTHKKKGQQ